MTPQMSNAEFQQRIVEESSTYEGIRHLTVPKNVASYGVRSIKRIQRQYWEITYVINYKDIQSGDYINFIWDCPNNTAESDSNYLSLRDQLSNIDRLNDFLDKGAEGGIWSTAFLYVLWEQIERDLDYNKPDIKDQYDDKWRVEELRKHPEYGKNGENALNVILASEQADVISIMNSQQAVVLTPGNTSCVVDAPTFSGGNTGILVGRIRAFDNQQELIQLSFTFCPWCFYSGSYDDDSYKKFDPPVRPGDVKWYVPHYEACERCHRKNPVYHQTLLSSMFYTLVTPCTYWKKYQISIAENTKKILVTPQKTRKILWTGKTATK